VEERVFIESPEAPGRSVFPDVRVVEHPGAPAAGEQVDSDVAVSDRIIVRLDDEPATEGYVEVIDVASGNRVVTVIEFLSTSNKFAGDGQDAYVKKQKELKEGRVTLVEIDLLRSGKRVLSLPPEKIPPHCRTTYQACVRRAWKPSEIEVYRIPLRNSLPTVWVPLRESDPESPLDLQALIDQCYRNGGYDAIDYTADPVPRLTKEDAAWAEALLRSKGLR
jgi:hypothetical protein